MSRKDLFTQYINLPIVTISIFSFLYIFVWQYNLMGITEIISFNTVNALFIAWVGGFCITFILSFLAFLGLMLYCTFKVKRELKNRNFYNAPDVFPEYELIDDDDEI